MDKVSPLVGARHIEIDVSDKRPGVSSIAPSDSIIRRRSRANTLATDVSSASSSKRGRSSNMSVVHDLDENLPSARPRKSPRLHSVATLVDSTPYVSSNYPP